MYQNEGSLTWWAPHKLQTGASQTPPLPPPLQGVRQNLR